MHQALFQLLTCRQTTKISLLEYLQSIQRTTCEVYEYIGGSKRGITRNIGIS